jgi:hypothetical protein
MCGKSKVSGNTSPPIDYARSFCLDANLSYKVGDALALVELPITHVYRALPAQAGARVGQCNASDADISAWCARTEHVLVTSDREFYGRWIRSGMLAEHGVEVIVFSELIPGLAEQHRRVTKHLPAWISVLGVNPYAHRVWVQTARQNPDILQGKRKIKADRASKLIRATVPEGG